MRIRIVRQRKRQQNRLTANRKGIKNMKKIILICTILASLTLGGCGKKADDNVDAKATIPQKIADEMTGDNKEIETYETSGELADIIKSVNKNASVSQTDNPGQKMLSVELPIDDEDKLSETFIAEVEKIVENTGLDKNTDYNYFYFSSQADGNVLVYASFKNEDGTFKADKYGAVDKKFEDSFSKAAASSKLFKAE